MARASQLQGNKIPLGQIAVGKQIGAGGFGVVHVATISGIRVPFAIKFLDPSPFNSDESAARDRFFREAEILFRLRHPHIIGIYGVGEHEGRWSGVASGVAREEQQGTGKKRVASQGWYGNRTSSVDYFPTDR